MSWPTRLTPPKVTSVTGWRRPSTTRVSNPSICTTYSRMVGASLSTRPRSTARLRAHAVAHVGGAEVAGRESPGLEQRRGDLDARARRHAGQVGRRHQAHGVAGGPAARRAHPDPDGHVRALDLGHQPVEAFVGDHRRPPLSNWRTSASAHVSAALSSWSSTRSTSTGSMRPSTSTTATGPEPGSHVGLGTGRATGRRARRHLRPRPPAPAARRHRGRRAGRSARRRGFATVPRTPRCGAEDDVRCGS